MGKNTDIKKLFSYILFFGRIKSKDLKKIISSETEKKELEDMMESLGLSLIETDKEISMSLDKEQSEYINGLLKDNSRSELTKTAMEILTLVLYLHPITKVEIDYIRGVNSGMTLRKLTLRGLIQKNKDGNSVFYSPTVELMKEMGITSKTELPNYEEFTRNMEKLINRKDND